MQSIIVMWCCIHIL